MPRSIGEETLEKAFEEGVYMRGDSVEGSRVAGKDIGEDIGEDFEYMRNRIRGGRSSEISIINSKDSSSTRRRRKLVNEERIELSNMVINPF